MIVKSANKELNSMLAKLSFKYFIRKASFNSVKFSLRFSLVLVILLSICMAPASLANSYEALIYDGDTLTLKSGEKVRLVQIDTPELSPAECYGIQAKNLLRKLVGTSTIRLRKEPVSANKDRRGRLLRYVFVGSKNINLELVRQGAAAPWFYNGERGRYANQLLEAAKLAQKNKIGLWKECPEARLDPSRAIDTGPAKPKSAVSPDNPRSDLKSITPGAFCAESDLGVKGLSSKGIEYTCKTSVKENRLRWRK